MNLFYTLTSKVNLKKLPLLILCPFSHMQWLKMIQNHVITLPVMNKCPYRIKV